jgi:hypothetical protein
MLAIIRCDLLITFLMFEDPKGARDTERHPEHGVRSEVGLARARGQLVPEDTFGCPCTAVRIQYTAVCWHLQGLPDPKAGVKGSAIKDSTYSIMVVGLRVSPFLATGFKL